jgi:hypothetical protein
MQTIKGLIGLVLVAVVVFIAALIINDKMEPGFIAKTHQATLRETAQVAKQPASPKTHTDIAGHKTANARG